MGGVKMLRLVRERELCEFRALCPDGSLNKLEKKTVEK